MGTFSLLLLGGAAHAQGCEVGYRFNLSEDGDGNWQLNRGSFPFFVKGVSGPNQSRPGLKEFDSPYGTAAIRGLGGNAFKTYGSDVKFGSDGVIDDNLMALQAACIAETGVAIGIDLLPFSSTGLGFVDKKPGGCSNFPIPPDNGNTCGNDGSLNYEDADQVAAQLKIVKYLVNEIISRATPEQRSAILFWVIGNEVASTGANVAAKIKVYKAIDEIATFIHGLGQGQTYSTYTMTAVPVVSATELGIINANASDLDLLGVNDYGGVYDSTPYGLLDQIVSTFDNARASGQWQKPWVLTEWGSYDIGVNPTAKLPFGTPFVQIGPDRGADYGTALYLNSTLEAESYADNYNGKIVPKDFGPHNNVGSFVFDWRAPAYNRMIVNWFEMYVHQALPNGTINSDPAKAQKTAVADYVSAIWKSKSGNRNLWSAAPIIAQPADCEKHDVRVYADLSRRETVSICPLGVQLVNSLGNWVVGTNVSPGEMLTATVNATPGTGRNGQPLTYDWFLYGGANGVTGGSVGADPVKWMLDGKPVFTFPAPTNPDSYRLWVVVRDQGGVPPRLAIADQTAAKATAVFGVK